MTAWPTTLPNPAIGTFNESPPDNSIRSSMDKGYDKVRRRTTACVRSISFTLGLTRTQCETLDEFYVTTTASGRVSFDYMHARIKETVEARFAQKPSYRDVSGVKWDCGVELEILP